MSEPKDGEILDFLRGWREAQDRRLTRIEERLGRIESEVAAWRDELMRRPRPADREKAPPG